jgi:predicted ATPase
MKISVEGYKSISENRTIDISGLTILSGANSSGKSSFMQPLLLIKQTIENDFDAGSLMLDGSNVRMTDSSQIISKVTNNNSTRDFFKISIIDEGSTTSATYKFRKKRGIHIDSVWHEDDGEFRDGVKISLALKPSIVESMLPEKLINSFKDVFGKQHAVSWKVVRDKCFLEVEMNIDGEGVPFGAGFAPARRLGIIASRLIHVPGLRGNPERSYRVASSESLYPGSFEKYVASIIHLWKTDARYKTRFNELKKSLNQLGLAHSIETSSINETQIELRISRFTKCHEDNCDYVNIADVGFGVSQTLPVLVALLAAKKNQMVYIEQPELHLHPRAQYLLAKLIAEAVKERGVNVIIETHSSVLIRGIQTLVASKDLPKNLVSLNWFTQDSITGQTNIVEAKLDDYGAFGDWPEDFDEVSLTVEQQYLDAVEGAIANE